MKSLCISIVAVLSLAAIPAMAQDCAAPGAMSAPGTVQGDTCSATNALSTICIFNPSPSNDVIYSFTIVADYTAATITVTPTTATFAPGLVIINGACSGNSTCGLTAQGAAGQPATLTVGNNAIAPGSYFLAVTGAPGSAATNCGAYGLTVDGSLPVTLQDFTVS